MLEFFKITILNIGDCVQYRISQQDFTTHKLNQCKYLADHLRNIGLENFKLEFEKYIDCINIKITKIK